jgi:hypothetical protein
VNKTAGEYYFTRLETVVFGVGKVESLGRELSRRGANRALIVTAKRSAIPNCWIGLRAPLAPRWLEYSPARRSTFLRTLSLNWSPRRVASAPTRW